MEQNQQDSEEAEEANMVVIQQTLGVSLNPLTKHFFLPILENYTIQHHQLRSLLWSFVNLHICRLIEEGSFDYKLLTQNNLKSWTKHVVANFATKSRLKTLEQKEQKFAQDEELYKSEALFVKLRKKNNEDFSSASIQSMGYAAKQWLTATKNNLSSHYFQHLKKITKIYIKSQEKKLTKQQIHKLFEENLNNPLPEIREFLVNNSWSQTSQLTDQIRDQQILCLLPRFLKMSKLLETLTSSSSTTTTTTTTTPTSTITTTTTSTSLNPSSVSTLSIPGLSSSSNSTTQTISNSITPKPS